MIVYTSALGEEEGERERWGGGTVERLAVPSYKFPSRFFSFSSDRKT